MVLNKEARRSCGHIPTAGCLTVMKSACQAVKLSGSDPSKSPLSPLRCGLCSFQAALMSIRFLHSS